MLTRIPQPPLEDGMEAVILAGLEKYDAYRWTYAAMDCVRKRPGAGEGAPPRSSGKLPEKGWVEVRFDPRTHELDEKYAHRRGLRVVARGGTINDYLAGKMRVEDDADIVRPARQPAPKAAQSPEMADRTRRAYRAMGIEPKANESAGPRVLVAIMSRDEHQRSTR